MSKETFKIFAKKHPSLANATLNNNITWQKLYEIYEIYGEDNSIWQEITNENFSTRPFNEIINTFKKLDLDTVQKGINNLQKTLGLFQELGSSNRAPQQEPKQLYRYFED